MLFLLCQAAGHRFGLHVSNVVEVLPRVRLQAAAGAPPWVAGLFAYNGRPTWVIDLSFLVSGQSCPLQWSSRIIVVHLERRGEPLCIGLLAERVETAQLTTTGEKPEPTPGLPAWGPVMLHEGELVQFLDLPRLLAIDEPELSVVGAVEQGSRFLPRVEARPEATDA